MRWYARPRRWLMAGVIGFASLFSMIVKPSPPAEAHPGSGVHPYCTNKQVPSTSLCSEFVTGEFVRNDAYAVDGGPVCAITDVFKRTATGPQYVTRYKQCDVGSVNLQTPPQYNGSPYWQAAYVYNPVGTTRRLGGVTYGVADF